ncbi:IS1 family transposase (plasmid) [Kovacikia minuta CCNUW1]|uniref:IS1 family transposase n=1 Tax=Kovacikia minuta TaxID=2931930 RepID=UPI001CCC8E18|nr:IS1 family transposase [Kovacikia minuta]UBF23850.1 IS1 family transposase [Kovacikia minuta CCNUW1]UBF26205.1 IS1 family transposase [Kovacikia minuta CCNUW1]UBF27203.1 IS1 family transposase [Kovacikia minuta CCNUW1]UBF27218.1 IS1 family transposase [Kovacikia minuta CCNUW1]UBF28782.1 IS1 family transposase [Kovacikia minuta CCNUW1]
MKLYLLCPTCGSDDIKKNGTTRRGKQNYRCRDCGRQFVEDPQWKRIEPDRTALIDRLLLEKIPLAGIARVMEVSEDWLQRYVNEYYEQVPQQTQVESKPKGSHQVQMDELWSFVDHKGNKQWVWLALDVVTREIIGCFIGDRSKESAQGLWESLPAVYRQCGVVYTDDWEAYKSVLPSKRHRVVGKETGLTSYIERFNNTLRQRVSRLVRKTLSFSKSIENHKAAIWNFIHHYNEQLHVTG